MGYVVDHTQSFREQVEELARVYPPEPKRRGNRETKEPRADNLYLQEAYSIVSP